LTDTCNQLTNIRFGLPEETMITLVVYNIPGQKVSQLVNEHYKSGYHEVEFNYLQSSSGIYFDKLQVGDQLSGAKDVYTKTKKMLMIK